MFHNMFAQKIQFICPRCLFEIRLLKKELRADYSCPDCKYSIPIAYIQEFQNAPPLFIQVFGPSQHGKTLFLDVLKIHLIRYIYQQWASVGYGHQSLTQLDIDKERSLNIDIEQGKLPGATQPRSRNQNEVYITRLFNMPRWGSRMLTIMDYPGEFFQGMDVPTQDLPFLVKTPTTLMVISLYDLIYGSDGTTIDHLLNFYIRAMERHRIDFKKQRRKLIFVFTKSDKLDHLPDNLKNYLREDPILSPNVPYLNGQHLLSYLERMQRVNNEIVNWLQTDPINQRLGTLPLFALLKDKNIEARYTLVSALGQDISKDHNAAVYITPKRVLDPFFWTLEFQGR